MMRGIGEGVLVDRSVELARAIKDTLDNPPEATSMHSGDNAYNNDIDWNKATQQFSRDWINWQGDIGALSFDTEPRQLEFALTSARKLVVQAEMTGKGHIDLANGDNCFCAGTFHFNREGYLEAIHLDSGHYRPTVEHGKYLIATLVNHFYDLDSAAGRENLEHFLSKVKIHVYNKNTDRFDQCSADDILTGRYAAALDRQRQEILERRAKEEAIRPLVTLVDRLLQFNGDEIKRLKAQSPKTGNDDHKAKITAFDVNQLKIQAIADALRGNVLLIDENAIKGQIKAVLADVKKATEMRTHKNIDATVSFFKCGRPVLTDSQVNYSKFLKTNQDFINHLDAVEVRHDLRL